MSAAAPSLLRSILRLGRASNLPTVWTDVLAAVVLSGAREPVLAVAGLGLAMSAFYAGGMFLSDAFEREEDAMERPDRAAPSGPVDPDVVLAVGFSLLAVGVVLIGALAIELDASPAAALSGLGLAAAIVAYDAWHAKGPLGPLLMGLCRGLVYVTAALASSGRLDGAVIGAAAALAIYVVGVSYLGRNGDRRGVIAMWPAALLAAPVFYGPFAAAPLAPRASIVATVLQALFAAWIVRAVLVAKEGRPDSLPSSIDRLIAGIALCDALFLAVRGAPGVAMIAAAGVPVTMAMQRWMRAR